MSSNIVHSQFGLTQPNITITEEPSLDQYNKRASSQSYSSSASESSTVSNTQPETQQPQQPQQKQSITQPSHPPSRTKKLVDKFATFSPRTMKSKSDRQLIVETAYSNRNSKKDSTQSPGKPPESVKHSKKKKRAPINITEGMSRADIFAANVASAVDAAEDADEEEDYIYSTSHSRTSSVTSLTSPQSQAIPFPHMPSDNNYGYPYHIPSYMYGTIHRSCNYLYRPPFNGGCYNNNNNNNNTSGSEADEVISNQLNRGGSQNNMISPNKPTGVMRSSLPDMSQYGFHKKGYPNYGPANFPYNSYSYWYDDDERLPLFAKWRPPDYETRQRQSCAPKISSLTVIVVFLLASSYLIYYATTRPLAEVSIIGITNVLAADKELMFNIHVKGRNSGLLNIEIVNANLNVFATPVKRNEISGSHWDDVISGPINKATPSEFLGNILSFDEPLVFVAGINGTGVTSEPSGQVRLRNPGGENDKEGQDRWSYIIRRQYDLTVRGFLEYNLPFSTNRVTVCYAKRVDNARGGGVENGDNDGNNDTNTKDTNSDTLGACGDWDKEQDKKDE